MNDAYHGHAEIHARDTKIPAFSVRWPGRGAQGSAGRPTAAAAAAIFREVLQAAATGGGDVRGPLAAGRLVAVLGQLPFPHTHDTGRQLRHLSTRGCTPPYVALSVGVMQRLHIWRLQGHRRPEVAAWVAGLRVG